MSDKRFNMIVLIGRTRLAARVPAALLSPQTGLGLSGTCPCCWRELLITSRGAAKCPQRGTDGEKGRAIEARQECAAGTGRRQRERWGRGPGQMREHPVDVPGSDRA
jgi:hypothetical protein